MVDVVTTLIEKAIQTDSDQEALAALRQARKHYRGTGTAVLPRRVRKDEVISPNTVLKTDHDKQIAERDETIRKLTQDNNRLGTENTNLKTAQMQGGYAADQEVLDAAAAATKSALKQVIISWSITAITVVAAVIVVAM